MRSASPRAISPPVLMPLPADEPDAALVRALQSGDRSALDSLFRRYSAELLRLASGLTSNTADAEDVVQDVFVGLSLALRRYEDRGTFRAWLRAVTVRTALMVRRRHASRRQAPLDEAHPATSGDSLAALALRDALVRLPEPLRDVFVLKVSEGYSHAEIAELLGIRSGTSEVRLFRAVRRLRDLLSEEG